MKQTNHKWYSTSNGKKLLLASLVAILGILVFLIIKFTLIEWVYIAISLLAITGMVVYNLLFRATPKQEGAEQSNAVSELKAFKYLNSYWNQIACEKGKKISSGYAFMSSSYFSKVFSAKMGCTPGDYRRRLQSENPAHG